MGGFVYERLKENLERLKMKNTLEILDRCLFSQCNEVFADITIASDISMPPLRRRASNAPDRG